MLGSRCPDDPQVLRSALLVVDQPWRLPVRAWSRWAVQTGTALVSIQGRRLPDTPFGELPQGMEPGDYWKYLDRATGEPKRAMTPYRATNLTGTVWGFYSPDGNGCGTLMSHTVREHEDGTISIRPGDGSSNSVLHSGGAQGKTWHGYVDHGRWDPC